LTTLVLVSACSQPSKPGAWGAQQSTGVAAFETVRAVLQHPRCQNCHPPGETPLQGDDSHVHAQNVKRGPAGRGMVGQECSTCHGPANPPSNYGTHVPPGIVDGWRMPPPDMKLVFYGITPRALCQQIKDPATNGGKDMATLRAHLDSPLVVWGWNPGFGRAPVSTPHEKFIAAWETWARSGAPCP
jgi:hypothetical protein